MEIIITKTRLDFNGDMMLTMFKHPLVTYIYICNKGSYHFSGKNGVFLVGSISDNIEIKAETFWIEFTEYDYD